MYEGRKVAVPAGTAGPWSVVKIDVGPEMNEAVRSTWHASGAPEGTYTALMHAAHGIVMIDTPAILATQDSALDAAHGVVVAGGLGLGAFAIAAAAKPEVTTVFVIEIDSDILSLASAPTIAAGAGKVVIVPGDARTGPIGDIPAAPDFVFLDIWPDDSAQTLAARENAMANWSAADEVVTWNHEAVVRKAGRQNA